MTASDDDVRREFAADAQHRFQQWIQFADAKAAAVLVLIGLGTADLIKNAKRLSEAFESTSSAWGDIATASFWLACTLVAVAVVLVSLSLFPRVKPARKSLAYFGDVASFGSSGAFSTALSKRSAKELQDETNSQVWQLARIASVKFRLLKWSYRFALGFLVALVVGRVCLAWSV